MYSAGEVLIESVSDTRSANYDVGVWAHLPHSCNEWVIGGKPQIEQLIADLQALLPKL